MTMMMMMMMTTIFDQFLDNFRSLFDDFRYLFAFRLFRGPSASILNKICEKSALRGPTINMKIEVFGDFWDPAGTQKSTKNQPGAEKVPPETAPEAIFCVFSRHCRSESV